MTLSLGQSLCLALCGSEQHGAEQDGSIPSRAIGIAIGDADDGTTADTMSRSPLNLSVDRRVPRLGSLRHLARV